MIHSIDKKLIEHRNKRRLYEGSHIYSEVARYFKCSSCQQIVCNMVDSVLEYYCRNLYEFIEAC